jgi:hypothetical protein
MRARTVMGNPLTLRVLSPVALDYDDESDEPESLASNNAIRRESPTVNGQCGEKAVLVHGDSLLFPLGRLGRAFLVDLNVASAQTKDSPADNKKRAA